MAVSDPGPVPGTQQALSKYTGNKGINLQLSYMGTEDGRGKRDLWQQQSWDATPVLPLKHTGPLGTFVICSLTFPLACWA